MPPATRIDDVSLRSDAAVAALSSCWLWQDGIDRRQLQPAIVCELHLCIYGVRARSRDMTSHRGQGVIIVLTVCSHWTQIHFDSQYRLVDNKPLYFTLSLQHEIPKLEISIFRLRVILQTFSPVCTLQTYEALFANSMHTLHCYRSAQELKTMHF